VSETPEPNKQLTTDTTVIVAFMIQGRPMAVNCLVTAESPAKLFSKDPRLVGLEFPQSVILVWHADDHVTKGEAVAISIEPWKTGYSIEVQQTEATKTDRRIYPRYPIDAAVSLRSISEVRESTIIALSQGSTRDVSLGGTWIEVQPLVPLGSVVECHLNIDGNIVQALALVAHENPNRGGNGLEFIEFYGDDRAKLEELLKKSA
jgi:hypothetical protein